MTFEKKKNTILKKILKWVACALLIIVISLVAIPYLFKDKIVAIVTNTLNDNINATLTFTETNLSLFKKFPLVSLTVNELAVTNKGLFLGDTLFNSKALSLSMKITELFKKSEEPIIIQSIAVANGNINLFLNKEGKGNFDIVKQTKDSTNTSSENSFSLNIEAYELTNINFKYHDRKTNTIVNIENIKHTGKGNLTKDIFNLETKTRAFLSFTTDKTNYLDHVEISLNALLGIDLQKNTYSFKENTGYINQLPLEFDGFMQLIDENQFFDLHFKTPTSSFKNALALLPKQYTGDLKTIKTQGSFEVNGIVNGTLSDKSIPTFDIQISSKNALFKYADFPKSVKKINIDSKIVNKTGNIKDTYIAVNKLNFKIDEDIFSANGSVRNITTNPNINLAAKGTINLANIGKVYPAPLKEELTGVLNIDITTDFDFNAVKKGNYQKIKNAGEITIHDFKYDSKEVAQPFFINKAGVLFNSNSIKLNKFEAKTGTSDLSITGDLENFYGFIFKEEVLKGNFILNANNLKVADFIGEEISTDNKESSRLKIPPFLEVKFTANAKKVVYDDMHLSNVFGTVFIQDETVILKNLKSDVFGGNIAFNGTISTKETTSKFKMDLNLKKINIGESFGSLEMLKPIAPIGKTIEGKMNSTLTVSGALNEDMTPNLKSISGDLLGQLIDTKIKASNSKMLTTLSDKVPFLNVNKLNLQEATGLFSFENGQVNVKPIQLNYEDIGMQISGKHGFDQTMDYDIIFDVPVKYLGTDVTNLIAKLSSKDAASVKSIPVKGTLTGSFGSPNFSSNMKNATATLVKDLVKKQKNSLVNKGKYKLKKIIGIDTKEKDTAKEEGLKDKIKNIFGGLLDKKK
ncbi:MAG: Uncharacterised protein [Polaribacter sejongensis]|nr:MAG: Uncharacterised protein [Polaribacter sejongensis]